MSKKFGPFSYFRVKKGRKNFISAWPTGYDSGKFGWEWGTDEVGTNPSYCLKIAHLNVFSYEVEGRVRVIYVLGFWWMS